ncbi:MAG: UDP-glucose/GDP-mannose dehydrogenase family protein [Candidatus Omnitrophica bacterium]|nr:UDP-glucose/GDP-mannose dehydrogenase family protein [Candidatus Omnitrophota bacterium]
MDIAIIGSGYVGLVTGTCFAHLGHRVLCVDKDVKKIDMLRKGKSPIYEPGLEEMIRENVKEGRLRFSLSTAQAVRECELIFISVNTPPKDNGEADLSYIESVSHEIAKNIKSYRVIIEKSTVPVQTGEWIQKTIRANKVKSSLFDVASNPEFLREGSAIRDFLNPDRIILGVSSPKAEKILRKLYEPFKAPLVVTNLASAELIKHASNSFLATKISFVNMLARICDVAGADIEQVTKGMGLDPRIGASFLKAGIGFGGFCFPKDLSAFLRMSEKLGPRFSLLKEVLSINETQKLYFVRKIESAIWNLRGKTLGVLGLAFKPDTDDMRFAPSVDIIHELQKEDVKVQAYDPQSMERAKDVLHGVRYVKDPYAAAKGADALLVLTEWSEFLALDFKRIKKIMNRAVIFDGRNMYNPSDLKKLGFEYHSIGRGMTV